MTMTDKKLELTDDQIEQVLFDAMRLHGLWPPSVKEVAALDAELASFEPPFRPADPNELLKRLVSADTMKTATVLPPIPFDAPSVCNLAHAAREGGELTTEIMQRMADNKEKFLREEYNDQ